MIKVLKIAAACLIALALGQGGHATDLLREQRMADEMTVQARGEAVQLEASGVKFQALYREAVTKEIRGGVILVPGMDATPDATELVQPLRKRLPERAWDTLALQPPLREAGADLKDYLALLPEGTERIRAGVAYMKARKQDRIALVGDRTGALIVLRYLTANSDRSVTAAVIIDPPLSSAEELDAAGLTDLGKLSLPLLDMLSDRKGSLAEQSAQARKRIMKQNGTYRQTTVVDPQPRFKGEQDLLVNRIHGWLVRSFAETQYQNEPQSPRTHPDREHE
jgi:dienelactone hydrolase